MGGILGPSDQIWHNPRQQGIPTADKANYCFFWSQNPPRRSHGLLYRAVKQLKGPD